MIQASDRHLCRSTLYQLRILDIKFPITRYVPGASATSRPPIELLRRIQLAGDGQQASSGKQRNVLAYVKYARDKVSSGPVTIYKDIARFDKDFALIQTTNAICWTSVRIKIRVNQEDDKKRERFLEPIPVSH